MRRPKPNFFGLTRGTYERVPTELPAIRSSLPAVTNRGWRICFFAAVDDPALFDLVEFYRQDIQALRELGHEVRTVNRIAQLRPDADAYWVWWPTSGAPAVLLARLWRRPVVLITALSERDATASGLQAKPPWTRGLVRLALRVADLTLATSDDTRDGLRRFRSRELRTAHLSVDTETYSPGAGEEDDGFVLTISHLTKDNVERKRVLDVVHTAAVLRDRGRHVRFVIAGEKRDGAPEVEHEIKRLELSQHVHLAGRVSAEEKLTLLRSAAIYFQPTTYEAFGMAVAEAMACARPVLSNAVGAVPEVVGHAGVLLRAAADAGEYAAAVDELLADPTRRHALGGAACERIRTHFGREQRQRAVEESLAVIMRERGPARRRVILPDMAVGLESDKSAVRAFWQAAPCGAKHAGAPEGTAQFYADVERTRHQLEPFIPKFADFEAARGQEVLEIGVGLGTDFTRFARAGARVTGIDLTERAVENVRRRLALERLEGRLEVADAERLPFADETFDVVYSWGVLHHTPRPEVAMAEAQRVLRPGGRTCVMLYARRSWVALGLWIRYAVLKGRPWQTLGHVVANHMESDGTRAYTRNELRRAFAGLEDLTVEPVSTPYDRRVVGPLARLVSPHLGWFLVVRGYKPL